MIWFVIFIAVVGFLFYRLDKKFKQKYNDSAELPDWAASPLDASSADATPFPAVESPTAVSHQPMNSYKKSDSFLSVAEQSFYGALKDAFADQYLFFAKIRAVDVVRMNSEVRTSQGQQAAQKFNSAHFDFIICDNSSFSILCAIKLNDRSVQSNNLSDNQFLESVCQNIQLPLIYFDAKNSYSTQAVRIKLLPHLSFEEKTQLPTRENEPPENKQEIPEEKIVEDEAVKICPQCSSVMIKRKAKSGAQAGKLFWACSTYPTCRSVLPVNDN